MAVHSVFSLEFLKLISNLGQLLIFKNPVLREHSQTMFTAMEVGLGLLNVNVILEIEKNKSFSN